MAVSAEAGAAAADNESFGNEREVITVLQWIGFIKEVQNESI